MRRLKLSEWSESVLPPIEPGLAEGGGCVLPRTSANLRAGLESAGVEFVETKPIAGVEIHLPEGVIVRLRRE